MQGSTIQYKFIENLIDPCFLEFPVSSDRRTLQEAAWNLIFVQIARSRRGFTLVGFWTMAKLLSRRVASMRITRRVALRRGKERPTARQRRHASTTGHGGDKRFIVLSFYAPDSLECELHYFAIVARARRARTIHKSPWPLRWSALEIRDDSHTSNRWSWSPGFISRDSNRLFRAFVPREFER